MLDDEEEEDDDDDDDDDDDCASPGSSADNPPSETSKMAPAGMDEKQRLGPGLAPGPGLELEPESVSVF